MYLKPSNIGKNPDVEEFNIENHFLIIIQSQNTLIMI